MLYMKLIIALILGIIVSFGLYKKDVFAHKEKSELYEAGAGVVTAAIAFALLTLFAGGSPADVADEKLAVDNDVKVIESEKGEEKEEDKGFFDRIKEPTKDKKKKEEKEVKFDDKKNVEDDKKKDVSKKEESNKKSDNKKSDKKTSTTKKITTNSNVKAPSKGSSTKPSTPSKKPSQSKPSAPSKKPSKPADKVEYVKHQDKEVIQHDVKYEETSSLYIGEEKVKVKGQDGHIITEYSDKYVNGKWVETTTKVVDRKEKVDEVILKGTKMKKHINDSDSRQIFHEVNAHRKANGVPQLQWDETLYQAAKVRAEELIEKIDHTRPNGTLYFTAIDEAGVVHVYSGENIAAWQSTVNEAMNSWKNSPGHNGNMLNPSYTHMASAKMESSDGNYWVQLFIHR